MRATYTRRFFDIFSGQLVTQTLPGPVKPDSPTEGLLIDKHTGKMSFIPSKATVLAANLVRGNKTKYPCPKTPNDWYYQQIPIGTRVKVNLAALTENGKIGTVVGYTSADNIWNKVQLDDKPAGVFCDYYSQYLEIVSEPVTKSYFTPGQRVKHIHAKPEWNNIYGIIVGCSQYNRKNYNVIIETPIVLEYTVGYKKGDQVIFAGANLEPVEETHVNPQAVKV